MDIFGNQGKEVTPPVKVDLALISLEDLYSEICRRHDSVILSCVIHKSVQHYQVLRRYYGHRYSCLAMCSNLASMINIDENNGLTPAKEQ